MRQQRFPQPSLRWLVGLLAAPIEAMGDRRNINRRLQDDQFIMHRRLTNCHDRQRCNHLRLRKKRRDGAEIRHTSTDAALVHREAARRLHRRLQPIPDSHHDMWIGQPSLSAPMPRASGPLVRLPSCRNREGSCRADHRQVRQRARSSRCSRTQGRDESSHHRRHDRGWRRNHRRCGVPVPPGA